MEKYFYPGVLLMFFLSFISCSSSSNNIRTENEDGIITDNRIPPYDESEGKDFLKIGSDLMISESAGIIRIGMKDSEIIKELGKPDIKTNEELAGADGLQHQKWSYVKKGIELGLVRGDGYLLTEYIKISSPCEFMTKRKIKIGSSRSDVIEVYGDEIDSDLLSEDPDKIVAGTLNGGLIFNLDKDSKVTSIIIGALAE